MNMNVPIGREPKLTEARVVHRLQLPLHDHHQVEFPLHARIIKLAPARDGSAIDLWYERNVASSEEVSRVCFYIYGTGQRIASGVYVDTIVMPNDLVWHVYLEAM